MAERCLEREGAAVQPRPAKQHGEESGPGVKTGLGARVGEGPRARWLPGAPWAHPPGTGVRASGAGALTSPLPLPLLWAEWRLQSPVLES